MKVAVIARSCSPSSPVVMAKSKSKSKRRKPQESEQSQPRITSNVKQNLQFLRLMREFQKQESSGPKVATSYRRKKIVPKKELPEEKYVYRDSDLDLYDINDDLDTANPLVLLVDGYNVCGYWPKLKKHFLRGRLDIARQKLIDELITYSAMKEVKVVVVFDAMTSGLPTCRETFGGIDVVYSGDSSADTWIEKEVVNLKENGCPKVWVATSDSCQQQAANWGIKASRKELQQAVEEHRSTSMQGRILQHNLNPEVVSALKDLKKKLPEC